MSKRSTDGSIIVTEVGEGLKHPDGVPEENIGQPEFTDWRERAFDLARQLNDANERIAAMELVNAADNFELRITKQMLEIAEREVHRRQQRSIWRRLLDFLWEMVVWRRR